MFFKTAPEGQEWAVCYDKAIRDDGSLSFPERLSEQFLKEMRKAQGSYIWTHQYQNEIIPSDDQDFKKEWLLYYQSVPKQTYTFAFIDPAISLEASADYTAVVVVDVDTENTWYVRVAKRQRITATQTIELIFKLATDFKCKMIGIETVAYQKALMHFLSDEMRKRKVTIPIHAVNRGPDISKGMRIRSLVPRFEWQRLYLKPGLYDLEDELNKFPRGSHDDLLDALASIEEIAHPPEKPKENLREPPPNHPGYEKYYIRQLLKRSSESGSGEGQF